MQMENWKWLQLFADGGDGGSAGAEGGASATVDNSADDGRQRLRELGVPESKLRKNVSYGVKAAVRDPAAAEQAEQKAQTPTEPDDTAQKPTEEQQTKRLTWDEIKADPEYQKSYQEETQHMVRERVKNVKQAQEDLQILAPALESMAKVYGMDPEKINYRELAEHIQKDDRFYEDRALELGVDPSLARKAEQFDLMEGRAKRQQEQTQKEQAMQKHFEGLVQQAEALKGKYPGFDLKKELENPTFMRMTAPGVNLSVEDAYYAVHRREIEAAALEAANRQTAKNIANAVRSGTMRPQENGASAAPSVTSFNYKTASKEQRDALKKLIREAGARGEKIYPGQ